MATPPDSPIEEVVYELEPTRVPKPIPVALEDLCRQTKFTRQEIRVMYRGFKTKKYEFVKGYQNVKKETQVSIEAKRSDVRTSQHRYIRVAALILLTDSRIVDVLTEFEYYDNVRRSLLHESDVKKESECPEGVVHEDCFKDIYAKFFPHGNSSLYAHYVFKAFDVNCNGAISFKDLLVTLSTLLRGSVYERLRWTFKLYDVNGDGCISRGELDEVVKAIHELMGRRAHQPEDDRKCRDQVDRVFRKLDLNQDGVITIEEFLEACLKDDLVTRSLQMFDTEL